MTTYVVDSGVAAKWYVPEVHSVEASYLLEERHELHVPDLLFTEVGNVLWKKVGRGELTRDEARDILHELLIVPLESHSARVLLDTALKIALDYSRTVYDGLYLALAQSLDCQAVTADDRLFNALQNTSLASRILHVRDLTPSP